MKLLGFRNMQEKLENVLWSSVSSALGVCILDGAIKEFWDLSATFYVDLEISKFMSQSILT